MRDDWVPENPLIFSEYLLAMFKDRVERKTDIKKVKSKRQSLSKAEPKDFS